MGALVLIHLILHWGWIVNTTKCFFRKDEDEPKVIYTIKGLNKYDKKS